MAWGLDDLRKLVNGLADTVNGGSGAPIQNVGMHNVQDAIVKPGKLLADFSGVTQGVKGVDPKASNMDRGLALLALAGMLGGQEAAMGLKSVLTPEYAYGIHVSPTTGLKKIKPGSKVGMVNGGNFGDANDGMAYFFKSGKDEDLSDLQKAVNNYLGRLNGGTRGGATAYSVRTPLKHTKVDENMGRFATQTPKNLKVLNSKRTLPLEIDYNFLGDGVPTLTDKNQVLESIAKLIKDNPKYSKLDSKLIFKPFEEKMNQTLAKEIAKHEAWKKRPKPIMVEAKRPVNKKTTP